MELTRHFTVSVYVVHDRRVLLHWHRRLELWLPVGGHIERDELPEDAAVREVYEESGLRVQLYRPRSLRLFDQDQTRELISPAHFMVQGIQSGHQHIDFSFYALSDSSAVVPESGLPEDYRWLAYEELDALPLRENVRFCASAALQLL